jgi:serine/threonine-protein phosphatase 6 regulatory subunit 3
MSTPSPAAAAASEFGASGPGAAAGGGGRMATGPGGGGDAGGMPGGSSASNRFARELARRENVETLVGYILADFQAPPLTPLEATFPPEAKEGKQGDEDTSNDKEKTEIEEQPANPPNFSSHVSSVVQAICMVIELIRKNNSDYFEPYLFHTLRNRLINIQQQEQLRQHEVDDDIGIGNGNGVSVEEKQREALESAMREMVDQMGVVHLGPVLDALIPKLGALKEYLVNPRSLVRIVFP